MANYVLGEKAARKLRALFSSADGMSRRAGPRAQAVSTSEFANPYEVRWAASANGGEGGFIIWLPSSSVLVVDGQPVDLTSDLTDAGDPYPSGWYLLEDMPSSGGSLYLNVTPGDPGTTSSADAVAAFSTSASETAGDIPILIATVSKDSTNGAVTVKQTVASALVFGTGKGGAAETMPAPFDYIETETQQGGETVTVKSITRCTFYFDGALQTLPDYTALPLPAGTVYLVGTGAKNSETDAYDWTFVLQNQPGAASTGSKVLNLKLYDFAGGKPVLDYRTTFLAVNAAPSFGEKSFIYDGVAVAKILADDDIDVGQKTLKAGAGVTLAVSSDGKTITISAPGAGSASTSGYTGQRTILGDTFYDQSSHALRRRYVTETWSNGVMVSQTLGAWETYHTAVQETV